MKRNANQSGEVCTAILCLKKKKIMCVCVCVCTYIAENILQNKSKTQRNKGSQKIYIYNNLVYYKNI